MSLNKETKPKNIFETYHYRLKRIYFLCGKQRNQIRFNTPQEELIIIKDT